MIALKILNRLLLLLTAIGLIAAGVHLLADADVLLNSGEVQRIGSALRWSGSWAKGPDGCFFHPDRRAWIQNIRNHGAVLIGAGVLFGGVFVWTLRTGRLR